VTLEAYTAACELRAALAAAADVETGEVKDERVLQYFAEIGDVLAKLEPQSLPAVVEREREEEKGEEKGEEAKPETEEGETGEEKDKEEAEKPAQPTLPMGPQVRPQGHSECADMILLGVQSGWVGGHCVTRDSLSSRLPLLHLSFSP
jgi:hypothetical protein